MYYRQHIKQYSERFASYPGVKIFLTGYDVDGKVITIGNHDIERISRLLHHKHKLQRKIKQAKKHRKRYNYRKAYLRLSEKISHLVSEWHKKTASWLTKTYDGVYIPKLNFHNCSSLNKKSKEKLATLRHCALVDRIKHKTRERMLLQSKYNQSCSVFEVNESFTSKSCSGCGAIDKDLGNRNVYKCNFCGTKMSRDFNGAVNILLRYITRCLSNVIITPKIE
jgi:putative transposase